jgi:hypothetical protein
MATDWIARAREDAVEVGGRRSADPDIAALASCIVMLCDELANLRRKVPGAEPVPYERPELDTTGEPFHDQNAMVERVQKAAADKAKKELGLE